MPIGSSDDSMDESAILADEEDHSEQRRDLLTLPISFNVDSLDEFKPILCVDNGFASPSESDLAKATHIVIQQSEASTSSSPSWAEAAAMPVLPVRCKNTSAEFHKAKFGSGSRGKCILVGKEWSTPIEFEALCGRGSSKDWKRSIRFGGHSIQTLIDENVITPHATSCTCANCCDDLSVAGPVRYFIRNKRRRRSYWNCECKKKKSSSAEESDADKPHKCFHARKEEAWQSLTDGLDAEEECLPSKVVDVLRTEEPEDSSDEATLKELEDLGEKAAKIYAELQKVVAQAEKIVIKMARKERPPAESPKEDSFRKCANCGREATAECSLCRQTPYCSTFCQRRDWSAHQEKCVRVMVIV